MRLRFLGLALCAAALGVSVLSAADKNEKGAKTGAIRFERTQLDPKFRSEGVGVGDLNHDGKPDIAAGGLYFSAPDWKPHEIIENPKAYDPMGYSNMFCQWVDDLNGDGWNDVIAVDFPGQQTWWFENPKGADGPWKRHVLTPVTNNESPAYLDVDGDKKRDLICAYSTDPANVDGPERRMGIISRTADPLALWKIQAVSAKAAPGTQKYSHGLGVGDVNRDGRNDVLVKEGWWEGPARQEGDWTFHAAPFGQDCSNIHVYDFDGDGDNDVLTSAAHQLGIWWHEQTPDGWKTHLIDKSFSQTHSLVLADINGDGLPDFVTGKRYWAHGPNGDVDPGAPAVIYWFELSRKDGKPVWTPHAVDNDSGVGTQFEVADVDGDGLLDIVTSNKKGVHYFHQVRD
ncbi:MAG TPA: VCBS repeat-containing protein [Pirellulales bacterium]|jgi:hypothetical protein